MTRKHYEALAKALRGHKVPGDIPAVEQKRLHIVQSIADVLQADNARFDRQRFYEAAGVGSKTIDRPKVDVYGPMVAAMLRDP